MSRTTWNFHTADHLVWGPGGVGQIGSLLESRGVGKAFIVTDANLAGLGAVSDVRASLAAAGIDVEEFVGGCAEPSIDIAHAAIAAAREAAPDGIIGIGGGSNMDLAKIVAVCLTHGGEPADYFGWDRVPGPTMPLACIPTTSGTGSEVSHAAVLTDVANEMKVSTLSNWMRPTFAIVDPDLTLSCPAQVTADSGIDALTHAIEAMTAVDSTALEVPVGASWPYDGRHPLGVCLAEKAVSLVGEHLETAVREPSNRAAREGMSLAATLAGMAFSNCGVAIVHALEYPIGGALHCSHGAGNGLLLPFVMEFNRPERTATMARIAELLGEDIAGLTEDEAARSAIEAVQRLKAAIGIPERIRDLGGTEDQLPGFAAKAFGIERLMLLNGRRPTESDLLEVLQNAF